MKTKLLIGLIGACFAAPALAQSSVTIYGIADAGFNVSGNGEGTRTKLVSGIADGSRLGFKGMEDMGGGYKAIFNLEARVELDTGKNTAGYLSDNQGLALTRGMDALPAPILAAARAAMQPGVVVNTGTAIFDRTSMVGLVTPVGGIMLGRMYTPAYEILAIADTFETGTAGAWGGITGGSGGILTSGIAIRSSGSMQYRLQLPNGISGSVMYGAQDSGDIALYKRFLGVSLKYKAGAFDVGFGYNNGQDQSGNASLITAIAGGSYTIGDMKLFGGYATMRNDHSVFIPLVNGAFASTFAGLGSTGTTLAGIMNTNLIRNFTLDANSYSLGMQYRMGAGRLMTSISHLNDKTSFDNDTTQYALGYDYNLSKRTDIYTVTAFIENQNQAQYAPGAASAPGGFTSAPGTSGRALQIGMRHKF